jgi:hypothetical protein
VLGNPPWERIKLQEEEHFIDDTYISGAKNKAERAARIEEYRISDDSSKRKRIEQFMFAKHRADAETKFVRNSARFPLTGVGDVNTYALFAELGLSLLNKIGGVGLLLPTGLVTDETTRLFFRSVISKRVLAGFLGMDNERMLFPSIDHRNKFGLFCAGGTSRQVEHPVFTFGCSQVEWIHDSRRRFTLTPSDLELLNPNSGTCPVFRTFADAELAKKVYSYTPVLQDKKKPDSGWGTKFVAMFHMANDSGLFLSQPSPEVLPLYESKMFQQFDHRFGTFFGATQANLNSGALPRPTDEQKEDPNFVVIPRYWVSRNEVDSRLAGWDRGWVIAFRDITSYTLERSATFAFLPRVGVGHTAVAVLFDSQVSPALTACFVANSNSLVFDYFTRQKLAGTHLTYSILNQLPMLAPTSYTEYDINFVSEHVLRLVFTASDLAALGEDLGYHGAPFRWSATERATRRAQLDAYYAHLYGLTRDEVRYILDPKDLRGADFPSETFRVLKERELKECGEFRTQRLVLAAFDELAKSERFAKEMHNRQSVIGEPLMATAH